MLEDEQLLDYEEEQETTIAAPVDAINKQPETETLASGDAKKIKVRY